MKDNGFTCGASSGVDRRAAVQSIAGQVGTPNTRWEFSKYRPPNGKTSSTVDDCRLSTADGRTDVFRIFLPSTPGLVAAPPARMKAPI
eukprot:3037209-Pyramimonas_sp.AAC.1